MLKYLAEHGHEISFVSFVANEELAKQDHLVAPWCKRVETIVMPKLQSVMKVGLGLFSGRPFQVNYFNSPQMHELYRRVIDEEQIELVYGYHLRTAQFLAPIKDVPTVLDLKPVQSLNLRRMHEHVRNPARWLTYKLEHNSVRHYEPKLVGQMSACLVISERDRAEIDPNNKLDNIHINPHGLDPVFFSRDHSIEKKPNSLLFSGVMSYDPNKDAVKHFCKDILPLVRAEIPDVTLSIVGKNPDSSVLALAADPAVTVTGFVDSMLPYMNQAEVAIDPLRIGAGLQNKVLEAMSMELPIVMSTIANEGIGATPDVHGIVSDCPREFAQHVIRLLRDASAREQLTKAARKWIVDEWSWEKHFDDTETIMANLVAENSWRQDAAASSKPPRPKFSETPSTVQDSERA